MKHEAEFLEFFCPCKKWKITPSIYDSFITVHSSHNISCHLTVTKVIPHSYPQSFS